MCVTAQWLKFSLNKFRERFQIRKICEIKDPRNISTIRYCRCLLGRRWVSFPPILPLPLFTNNNWTTSLATFTHRLVVNVLLQLRNFVLSESHDSRLFSVELSAFRVERLARERERNGMFHGVKSTTGAVTFPAASFPGVLFSQQLSGQQAKQQGIC